MTEQEAKKFMLIEKECINRDCNRDCAKCDIVQKVEDLNCAYDTAIKSLEEVQKYRAIGTPDECRAAVEKQKEMIAYCDENDCSDCPFHNTSQKYNKCMNDFIAEKISKGVCNACIDAMIGGGDN